MKKFLSPAVIITLAVLAGVVLFWRQIQDLLAPLGKAGKAAADVVGNVGGAINDALQNIGVGTSSADTKVKEQATVQSCWSPGFYKNAPGGAKLLKVESANNIAREIYYSLGFFADDFSRCMAAFRQCTAKTQISFLAEIFAKNYNEDLLEWVAPSSWNFDFRNRFSETESKKILDYVESLPNF